MLVSKYDVGWAVRLEDLYVHAVAYQPVRALRLVRLRQTRVEHASFRPTFNLAGLPREVFDMILDNVMKSSIREAETKEPIIPPFCDCMLIDNLWRQEDALDHFQDYCKVRLGQYVKDPLDEKCIARSRLRREFQTTPYCKDLLDTVRAKVADGCIRCETAWIDIWKTMACMGTLEVEPSRGRAAQQLIIGTLDACGYSALQFHPFQTQALEEYEDNDNEDEEIGSLEIVEKIRHIFVVVMPNVATSRGRRHFIPEFLDTLETWQGQYCPVRLPYRMSPLHYLLQKHARLIRTPAVTYSPDESAISAAKEMPHPEGLEALGFQENPSDWCIWSVAEFCDYHF